MVLGLRIVVGTRMLDEAMRNDIHENFVYELIEVLQGRKTLYNGGCLD